MSIFNDTPSFAPRSLASRLRPNGSRAILSRRLVVPLLAVVVAWSAAAEEPERAAATARDLVILDAFVVEARAETQATELIDSRALKLHKIVDLAEILSGELVEASIVRKSGYGNEVNLRGFSQANLPILVNGGFLEGACGSRKDPALSHINLLTVERIVVREGPYDVAQPGNLGGYIDVITKQPEAGFSGETLVRIGSYGFHSAGATTTGGTDRVQVRAGYNYSEAGQYADGDGAELWELREGRSAPFNAEGRAAAAFSKHDAWGALRLTPNATHVLQLDYAFGEASDILNPRGDFDTARETTKLARLSWTAKDLGAASENLTVSAYYNAVGHDPTQELRTVAAPKRIVAKSAIAGAALQNEFHAADTLWTCGVDTYQRTWKGDVFNATTGAVLNPYLLPTAKTLDLGMYLRGERTVGPWQLSSGLRWDTFCTKADEALPQTAKVTAANRNTDGLLGGYVTARYAFTERSQLFAGVGRSYRAPTGAERYIQSSATFFGNPELEPIANTEIDLGWRTAAGPWSFQVKGFYSDLSDYIYQVKTLAGYQTYAAIDAHLYGADAKASCALGSGFTLAGGIAWQRGRKDTLPDNNTDRDLGQMSPLKTRVALDYERELTVGDSKPVVFATLEWVHGNASRDVDIVAGEKVLPAWDAANLRVGCQVGAWSFTAGLENVFDAAYAVANSYEWDVVGGTASNPIVVSEPGRFAYLSAGYSW